MKRSTRLLVGCATTALIAGGTFAMSAGADHPVHHDGHHHLIHVDEHGHEHYITVKGAHNEAPHLHHGDVHGVHH